MAENDVTDEVILEPKGAPMERFQEVRTAALSQMFAEAYASGNGIYQTSRVFARLDNCVRELLAAADRDRQFAEAVRELIDTHRGCWNETNGQDRGCTLFEEIDVAHRDFYHRPCTAATPDGEKEKQSK